MRSDSIEFFDNCYGYVSKDGKEFKAWWVKLRESKEAVEVLKNKLNNTGLKWERDAYHEALLALEENPKLIREVSEKNTVITIYDDRIQNLTEERDKYKEKLDRLEKWLDKEVELIETTQEEHQNQVLWEQLKLQFIKEVREVLQNGKQ